MRFVSRDDCFFYLFRTVARRFSVFFGRKVSDPMEPLTFDENKKVILPQPDEIPDNIRETAAGAYIMMFAAQYLPLPLINLIAALIYYLVCRKRERFVAFHAYQSFISQIPTSLALWGGLAWLIVELARRPAEYWDSFFSTSVLVVLSVILLWNLIYTILSLIAYRRARTGRFYYLPLFGKHSFNRYYGPNAVHYDNHEKIRPVNRPPA